MKNPGSIIDTMTNFRFFCRLTALALLTSGLISHAHATLVINQPWVRSGPSSSAAYMRLTSSEGAALVAVTAPSARQVTLRGPSRPVSKIDLQPGVLLELKPNSYHVELKGLPRLKPGSRVPLVLVFDEADGTRTEIPVQAEVRLRSPSEDELRPHTHHSPLK